jgi:hypothetical protein
MTTTNSYQNGTTDARTHSPEGTEPLGETFDALANRWCRVTLQHLVECDGALVVDDLVSRLADELDDDGASETRLETSLHHAHLPKLDDANLIDYDPDRGLVRLRANSRFEELAPAIVALESADSPIPTDALLGLLANFRRRKALLMLVRHDDLPLPDLADEVAIAERDEHLSNIDPNDVLEVYLSLYHTHVPKLAAAGLVDYDQDDDYLALTRAGRALASPVRSLCNPADR